MTDAAARLPRPKVHDFPSLREGQTAVCEFTIGNDEMATFAALSGDYNPLHCDPTVALAGGFGGRVVYGALLLAKVSQIIGMELPGRDALWTGIDMQFVHPLIVGEQATLLASVAHTSPATKSLVLRIRIQCGDRLIARGKASVSVRDAS